MNAASFTESDEIQIRALATANHRRPVPACLRSGGQAGVTSRQIGSRGPTVKVIGSRPRPLEEHCSSFPGCREPIEDHILGYAQPELMFAT